MAEPNLTEDEVRELHKLMPPPGQCPHGTLPARTATFGPINSCSICMEQAKRQLADKRAAG